MKELFCRSEGLLGADGIHRLADSHVMIVGLGGVGSYAAEAIGRSGVGKITVVDHDVVSLSNCNRQLCALNSTVGQYKADVVAQRLRDIHPDAAVTAVCEAYCEENRECFFAEKPDYIIDAIDMVSCKLDLIVTAHSRGIPIISALGTGNKLQPERLTIADIYDTTMCPLARVVRRELKKRGIASHTVVYSTEPPTGATIAENGRNIPGSIAWVPGCAGLMMAGYVVRSLSGAACCGGA